MAKRTSTKQVSELASLIPTMVAAPAPEQAKPKSAKLSMRLRHNKDFKPRTDNIGDGSKGKFAQYHNWQALMSAMSFSEDGTVTYEEAVQAVQHAAEVNGYAATANARGFVQGRIRGEHLLAA